jgi:regulator of protease activity HflC (stomatin/prohibitin superfamily)
MARITRYPLVSHLRSEASAHIVRYRNGNPVRSGRGLAFWFRPLDAAIAEIPLDDQELPFLFRGRSSDLQEVVAQGIITYRVTDPEVLAARIDFGIDVATGVHLKTPLEQIAARLTGLAQQHAWTVMASTPLRDLVADGVVRIRERIESGLSGDEALSAMGISLSSVRVSALQPNAETEKALSAPTRERIAGAADEASFTRRATAVDKERAIAENELANKIELAKRAALLVEQEGANERSKAAEIAAASRITSEGNAATRKIGAEADAEAIQLVETARNAAESDRIAVYRDLAPAILMGLAAREFAGSVQTIEHLNLTPDLIGALLGDLLSAGTKKLQSGSPEAS